MLVKTLKMYMDKAEVQFSVVLKCQMFLRLIFTVFCYLAYSLPTFDA